MNFKNTVAMLCVIVVGLSTSIFAAESQFPTRPVRILVPGTAGGGNDFLARFLAQRLTERWSQNVIVENRAGATGLIALEICARAAPDGYTFVISNVGQMVTATLSKTLSFDRGGDFTPIALSGISEQLLSMSPTLPAKSLKEFVDIARAKPGQLNYASSGIGSTGHLGAALFSTMAGIKMTHIPYTGAGPAIPDLLSGRVHLILTSTSTGIPLVQSGKLRGMAITGTKRTPTISEVPTFAEAGYPRYNLSLWFGIFGPARMPAALVARLNADFNSAVQSPEAMKQLTNAGMEPMILTSPKFAEFMIAESAKWGEAAKAAELP